YGMRASAGPVGAGARAADEGRHPRIPPMLARPRLAALSPAAQRRLLEILPGALTWLVLLAPVVAAFAIRLNDPTTLCLLGVGGWENVARLREEFGHRFLAFLHIKDPLLPGIVIGKSAAMAQGGPELRRACDELGLDPARTLVTDLDSDFRLHPQYWAYITAQFCSVPERLISIWQPVPLFTNNLWKVPAAVRVMATAATQWQMFLHDNPHRLVMFSSYTMPMRLLTEVGYWDSDVIPEDSRFFW